jgi:uncharacterized protein with HEPN domain
MCIFCVRYSILNRDHLVHIKDIKDSIDDILLFTQSFDFEKFKKDKKTQYAVIRCLEIIGEAANKVPTDVRKKMPEVPWQKMADMRNKMIHEYFGVDVKIIWDTVIEDIPYLQETINRAIKL